MRGQKGAKEGWPEGGQPARKGREGRKKKTRRCPRKENKPTSKQTHSHWGKCLPFHCSGPTANTGTPQPKEASLVIIPSWDSSQLLRSWLQGRVAGRGAWKTTENAGPDEHKAARSTHQPRSSSSSSQLAATAARRTHKWQESAKLLPHPLASIQAFQAYRVAPITPRLIPIPGLLEDRTTHHALNSSETGPGSTQAC